MNISLAHWLIPEDFGIGAELLAGLDRLYLGSTYTSNEGWRDRQILHLFLGEYLRDSCKKAKTHKIGIALPNPRIPPVACRIVGNPRFGIISGCP
jgi:hypothetical protein